MRNLSYTFRLNEAVTNQREGAFFSALSRDCRAQGDYAEAIFYAAVAADYYAAARSIMGTFQ